MSAGTSPSVGPKANKRQTNAATGAIGNLDVGPSTPKEWRPQKVPTRERAARSWRSGVVSADSARIVARGHERLHCYPALRTVHRHHPGDRPRYQNATVPGATVVVRNTATGVERTLVTDATGNFVAASVPPAPVKLRFPCRGFKRRCAMSRCKSARLARSTFSWERSVASREVLKLRADLDDDPGPCVDPDRSRPRSPRSP